MVVVYFALKHFPLHASRKGKVEGFGEGGGREVRFTLSDPTGFGCCLEDASFHLNPWRCFFPPFLLLYYVVGLLKLS